MYQLQSHTMSSMRGYPVPTVDDDQLLQTANSDAAAAAALPPPNVHGCQKSAKSGMFHRQLGKTTIQVSVISLVHDLLQNCVNKIHDTGCGAIGGLFGDSVDSVEEILDEALKNGINYIDTAYWYSQARSEQILGQALAKIPRNAYCISTKVGRFELDFSRPYDYRADALLEQLAQSLKRLKLTYVDICYLQLPDTDFDQLANIIFSESLEALQIAKVTGKTRYIGLAAYALRNMLYVLENSPLKMDVVMTYGRTTLCDNSFSEYRHRLELKGVGIVSGAPLSMGLLTEEGPPSWHPAPLSILRETAKAAAYCKSKGISLSKLAIDYAVQFPGIGTCLIGISNVDQLKQCLEIVHRDRLSDNEERIRSRILRRYFDKLNNANWEGIDLSEYWKRMEHINWNNRAFKKHCRLQLAKQQCICTMCT